MSEIDQSTAQSGPTGTRRHVTLLFSDLCDYTALNELVDPEHADAIRRQVQATMTEIIERHGGAINQCYGDGILAMFGFPRTDEQAVRRAVEAALEMHAAVPQLVFDEPPPPEFALRLHTGVHAGLVFARRGDPLHGRFELTGDAVNTTARLCAAAGEDEIVVSEQALAGVHAFFETERVPPLALKGKKQPFSAQRVLGRTGVNTRFEASSRRGLTSLVGRSGELACVEETLREVRARRARALALIGPPGIGKTRLLEEAQRRALLAEFTLCSGYCEDTGNAAPLQPFLQILAQLFGLGARPADTEAADAVSTFLMRTSGELESRAPIFLDLLSLSPRAEGQSADAKQRLVLGAFGDLFRALCQRSPLLLVIDDWQWADDASRGVLRHLLRSLRDEPLFVLLASRQRDPNDTLLSRARAIELAPFDERESGIAIGVLLPRALDVGLSQKLHERSGGNPLFLEELCQSLSGDALDPDEPFAAHALSSTIQGVIQARLERLPGDEARVLQSAAVIGTEFTPELLAEVTNEPELEDLLDALCDADLIYRTRQPGVFRFKHGITREVAYETVQLGERRRIHAALAAQLEARAATSGLPEHFESLAYHYRGSGDHALAAHYAALAGNKALETSSLDRARMQYRIALSELDKVGESSEQRRTYVDLSMRFATAGVYKPSREQLEVLERSAAYAEREQDARALAHVEYWRGWICYALGDQAAAIVHSRDALALAERIGDHKLHSQLLSNLGQCHAAAGEYGPAVDLLERALAAKRARAPGVERQALPIGFAYGMGALALVHGDRGDFALARTQMQQALEAVRGTGHPIEGSLLDLFGLILVWQGSWQECLVAAAHARSTGERVHGWYVFAMSRVVGSYAEWMLDGSSAALLEMERATEWLEGHDIGLFLSFNYGLLANAFTMSKNVAKARHFAERALRRAEAKDPFGAAMAYRALARLRFDELGELCSECEAWLEKALALAEARGSRREAALTHLTLGELYSAEGERERAREVLAAAHAGFEAMGMQWHKARTERLLGD